MNNKQIYENISNKYIQHTNRLSNQFNWAPLERVSIRETLSNGYILHNLDYCGNCENLETAFIDKETFINNFREII